jgi:2-polyprenyl-6-methoxyphenol hydroxylase-like FAD-dependent oxidoreductase
METLSDKESPKPVGSYPESGIDVLIIGTGLAGLTAAIECVRKGHKVRVLEKSSSINMAGIFIPQVAHAVSDCHIR